MSAEQLAYALGKATRSGSGWVCKCPAHDDKKPSLAITQKDDGKLLFHCFAGCSQGNVLEALKHYGIHGLIDRDTDQLRDVDAVWNNAVEAKIDHPYFQEKRVKCYGLKQFRDSLLIPLRAESKRLTSLQFISSNGTKKFLAGGKTGGSYFVIGQVSESICVCEGYATGASIYESTGFCTVVAFTCGNLSRVGEVVRSKFPQSRIIFAADDDFDSAGNPGVTKATKAALEVNGLLAIPKFQKERGTQKDFNDLYTSEGPEAVRSSINSAQTPPKAVVSTNGWELEFGSYAGKKPKKVKWLWDKFIPSGELTILYGKGGVGKSTLSCAIASIVSNGSNWPVTGQASEPTKCLLCEIEDNADSTTLGRLVVNGANLNRVIPMTMARNGNKRRPFSLKEDLHLLERALNDDPTIRLIVLSAITDFIDVQREYSSVELRRVLTPVVELAHRTGVAILGIAHPRKGDGGEAVDTLAGSHVWSAISRSVLLTCEDPDDPIKARRFLGQIKSNLCKEKFTISYSFESIPIECEGGEIDEAARVIWGSEIILELMESIFQRSSNTGQVNQPPQINDWLRESLASGPRLYKEIKVEGQAIGFSEYRLKGALKAIGGNSRRVGFGGDFIWSLPVHSLHSSHSSNPERMESMESMDMTSEFEEL